MVMLLASVSKMFVSLLLCCRCCCSIISPLDVDLGPVVDVDLVVSSLVRDDLEVLDVLLSTRGRKSLAIWAATSPAAPTRT